MAARGYQVIAQTTLNSDGTITDVYTVPASTEVVVSSMVLCNFGGVSQAVDIKVAPSGSVDANVHFQEKNKSIKAGQTRIVQIGMTLTATDKIRVDGPASPTIAVTIYGRKMSF